MFAPLCFSCPRCLLLRRGAERWAFGSLARQLAGNSSKDTPPKDKQRQELPTKETPPKDPATLDKNLNTTKPTVPEASSNDTKSKKKNIKDIEIPPEPTNCCMSGCANCVWLDYAQTLAKLLGDNDEEAREIVLSKITDPNLKMFLSLELRNLKQKREEEERARGEKPKPSK
ncbi:uncharacterized protein Dana_GF16461 [Drosophila ananassae]|uniref:Oxidoreductase-like domain-containing protein n=1 Tax=Drosophila ananassae TaxID=7217 RepID=B3M3B3_DROAN|nr:UPF0651 protein YPL107W, mitochondrial [Drosophila ananassae]XP_044571447.1 UPF0651 protein YPL107W, mitochondrial [Drosophila ananassae]EDV43574.1 uncharacterized protein Dana_GF16461 [Drosophila ananassae]